MLWLHLIAAIFAVIGFVPPAYSMNGDVLQGQTVRIAASSRVPNAVLIVIIAVWTSALNVRMHMLAPGAPKHHADIVFLSAFAAVIGYVMDVVSITFIRRIDAIFAMIGCASTASIIS